MASNTEEVGDLDVQDVDFQHTLFKTVSRAFRQEINDNMILKNLVEEHKYVVAVYNRSTDDLSSEEKSDRLWTMMESHPVQTMMSKEIEYRTSRRILKQTLGHDPVWYKLFDGCHRFDLTREFLAGKCYVKLFNSESNKFYYCWNTQAAVDTAKEHTGYNTLLAEEWRERLLNCPITMIRLHPSRSDTDAYERARVANQCKPLTHAQMYKCMCAGNTAMACVLRDLNSVEDRLSNFLGDDLYRYHISILRMFDEHSFDTNFHTHIAMLQGSNSIQRAHTLINGEDKVHDDLFKVKTLESSQRARTIVNSVLSGHIPKLREQDHSHRSAIGLIYFALTLACANDDENTHQPNPFISSTTMEAVLTTYLSSDGSQKGDNHKRFSTFFTTGIFPDAPNKKRKSTDDSVGSSSEWI
jgi:hypothetical protein